jgi:hypothetical protein
MIHLTIIEIAASMLGLGGLVVKSGIGLGSDPVPVINRQVCIMTRLSFVIALLWFYYYTQVKNLFSVRCVFSFVNLAVAVYLLHKVHEKERHQAIVRGYSESIK